MTSVDRWMLPEGVDELLPERAAVAEQIRRNILDLFNSWGYQLVVPPLIEFTDSLLIGMGKDVETQSFRLTDQISGKSMAVRADITPQTARIDAHSLKIEGVRRLCYAGSVLHTRPKTLMASRCPMQVGAELYGAPSISADIEVISLLLETLQVIDGAFASANGSAGKGLCKLTLDLGHVSIYNAVREAIQQAVPTLDQDDLALIFDAIQRKSLPDLKCLLPNLLAGHAITETLYQLPNLCGGAEVLGQAKELLGSLGQGVVDAIDQLTQVAEIVAQRFTEVEIYFDLAEIRGYEYHTGLVFAAYADGHGLALANGGRYDNIGKVFGSERSATGFNTDIKALIDFLGSRAIVAGQQASAAREIIAAPSDCSGAQASLWQAVSQLRSAGQVVIFNGEEGTEKPTSLLVQKSGDWVVEKIK
ncbi:MAG: ATP phosphoribosyltransferase regulatory subunit [Pseudomonadales bacterium]|nr:ATP phosphoribosyltransferase regulatory subunit [Pseudomonadales bacterium]